MSLGEAATGRERRQYERYPCPHQAQAFDGAQWRDCRVLDISAGGASVLASQSPGVGASVTLFVEDVAEMPGVVVRRTEDGFAVRFDLSPLTRH